jgi:hypothetical protein
MRNLEEQTDPNRKVSRKDDSRICGLDPNLPFVSRQSLCIAQFGGSAERIILLDVIPRFPLCS